jgi:hypothetical protein
LKIFDILISERNKKGIFRKMDKRVNKKTGEELQQYLQWRRRASRVPSGKEYNRRKFKKGE